MKRENKKNLTVFYNKKNWGLLRDPESSELGKTSKSIFLPTGRIQQKLNV